LVLLMIEFHRMLVYMKYSNKIFEFGHP